MSDPLPPGQGPIDPRGAFSPPPPPVGGGSNDPGGWSAPPPRPQMQPPPNMPPMSPPGYYPPPPPMFYPPPPRERSFTRMIFMTLATMIFTGSIVLNLWLLIFVAGTMRDRAGTMENTLVSGDAKQKIAVIPVSGAIYASSAQKFDRMMKSVESDSNIKAIVIEVDSPGGTVTASDEIYDRLLRYKAKHPDTPIVISMGSLAASGGYYVACAGDYIFAQPTSLTGSIGVLLPNFNVHEMFKKWGIEERTIVSSGADFKEAGSMFKPEQPNERAYFQALADSMFTRFKDIVKTGRQKRLKQPIEVVANGKIFTGGEAKDLGLVDQVGYLTDACDYAGQKAGLTNKTVVRIQENTGLLGLFESRTSIAPPSAGGGTTINGLNVNIDRTFVDEFLTPRVLYMWRGN